jgi:hypothetical protein
MIQSRHVPNGRVPTFGAHQKREKVFFRRGSRVVGAVGRSSTTMVMKFKPQPALSLLCEVRYRQKKWSQLQDAAERAVKLKSTASLGY